MEWNAFNQGRSRYRRQAAYDAGYRMAQWWERCVTGVRRTALAAPAVLWGFCAALYALQPWRFQDWPLPAGPAAVVCLGAAGTAFWLLLKTGAAGDHPLDRALKTVLSLCFAGGLALTVLLGLGLVAPATAALFAVIPGSALAVAYLYLHCQACERENASVRARRDRAISCRRCHALALPVPGTVRWYACERCGWRFAARARHNL